MYKLLPTHDDKSLFFCLDGDAVERYGAIGYLRADFGKSGREFHSTWFDEQSHLLTYAFKKEFDNVVNSLRDNGQEPPFASRENLAAFCAVTPCKELDARGGGYSIRTQDYSYYFRCLPRPGDYDIYCFAYDNRWLLPELAGKHELPDFCYSTVPSTDEVIIIKRNEHGYYQCEYSTDDPEYNRELAKDRNIKLGVTRAQEEAMLAGSMFGWDTPSAKPWHYDRNGKPRIKPKNKDYER